MSTAAAEKTLFRRKAETWQDARERTKSAKVGHGFVLLTIGGVASVLLYYFPSLAALFPVIGWAGYVIGRLTPPNVSPIVIVTTILVVKLLCFAGAVWGLVKVAVAWRSKVKSVKCPRCQQSIEMFTKVRKGMCPHCGLLMLMGELIQTEVLFSHCAYCGLGTGTTAD